MQEGNLVEFFPQDEKHRVQVLNALRDEIPPQCSCHLVLKQHKGGNREAQVNKHKKKANIKKE